MVGDAKQNTGSWLEHLPPSIKRCRYEGEQQFHEVLDAQYYQVQHGDASEWLLFEVPENIFSRDFINGNEQSTPWSSFSATEELLLVKMMTYEHAAALGAFGNALIQALGPMGLGMALQAYSGATIKGKDEKKSKQSDNGWGPLRPPHGHDRKWPTTVLEVAVSEAQPKLQSDVRFWLHEGQGKVKLVFTLTVDRQSPRITIDKWELKPYGDRGHRTQQVTVYQGANKRMYTTGTPLVIEFCKLFLRDPTVPKEKDIEFGEDDLKALATSIWLAQGFDVR